MLDCTDQAGKSIQAEVMVLQSLAFSRSDEKSAKIRCGDLSYKLAFVEVDQRDLFLPQSLEASVSRWTLPIMNYICTYAHVENIR